jgi:hypothetical protein
MRWSSEAAGVPYPFTSAAISPLLAQAQQSGRLPTLGILGSRRLLPGAIGLLPSYRGCESAVALRVALSQSIVAGRMGALTAMAHAAEFVRLKVDVIVTVGSAVPAARHTTSVIPIVLAEATDPM